MARIVVHDRDKYGRTVGEVYVDGTNVNRELIRNGLAWHYRRYDKRGEWDALEAAARQQKLGLWQDPHPEPPWEWRKAERQKRTGTQRQPQTRRARLYPVFQ